MNQLNTTFCQRCNHALVEKKEGSCVGLYCEHCQTWSFVTSYIPEILKDTNTYHIFLKEKNAVNKKNIQTVAEIAGVNFLEAKKIIEDQNREIFAGSAANVLQIMQKLEDASLDSKIEPEFPWGRDQLKDLEGKVLL